MTTLTLHSPLDMHLHLRQDAMLKAVAPLSAETFAGAVIMPNLVPPVDSLERLKWYREEILAAAGREDFAPYMTLFFRAYTREELEAAKPHIIGIKLYPAGITTNSEGGVSQIDQAEPTMRLMEELGIPLMIHGESNGFVMDREAEFLTIYRRLAERFPRLKIVMEHITTAAALVLLNEFENLHATVTVQHLIITLDDVAGGMLNPHLFCKPIAKRPEDREALAHAAVTAHPKLCLGTDSAPHPQHKKECCGCAAGVFTAPIALQLLAGLFDEHDALDRLQAFVSDNARRIYDVTPPAKAVTLAKKPFTIPASYGEVVPMWAGREIPWSVVGA
ncbi:dihydroorotase [Ruficoccus amylovorans]|uniref:Dihydroorotase n=2 Tax=Ruficoccus amylovorans TaxID=1804625 RepID=A0A842HAG6_9BACT|nr:dihydroorotase [Ruficoccus amylovorans]